MRAVLTEEARLHTVRFGAHGKNEPDNFDEWAGHSPNHILHRAEEHFSTEVAFWQLDRILITEQRIDPFLAERTVAHRLAAPTHQITFLMLFDGEMHYREGNEIRPGETGDIVLLDFERTYAFQTSRQHSASVSMARGILEDDIGPLRLYGRLPQTPETRMLFDFVRTLVRHLPDMVESSAIPAATILRRLIILALRQGRPPEHAPRDQAKRTRALTYIESQPPGTLDVTAISRDLRLTRATLYRLFKSEGGVLSYDRRRRLRLLHRSLCEEQPNVPLGELGARFGFPDPSNLSRQFKAEFGLSMSEVRRHLLPRSHSLGSIRCYREAIARFE